MINCRQPTPGLMRAASALAHKSEPNPKAENEQSPPTNPSEHHPKIGIRTTSPINASVLAFERNLRRMSGCLASAGNPEIRPKKLSDAAPTTTKVTAALAQCLPATARTGFGSRPTERSRVPRSATNEEADDAQNASDEEGDPLPNADNWHQS